ncbi:hypothetical protein P9112_010027 [Eukaryota sp. TZLM1-RC]
MFDASCWQRQHLLVLALILFFTHDLCHCLPLSSFLDLSSIFLPLPLNSAHSSTQYLIRGYPFLRTNQPMVLLQHFCCLCTLVFSHWDSNSPLFFIFLELVVLEPMTLDIFVTDVHFTNVKTVGPADFDGKVIDGCINDKPLITLAKFNVDSFDVVVVGCQSQSIVATDSIIDLEAVPVTDGHFKLPKLI